MHFTMRHNLSITFVIISFALSMAQDQDRLNYTDSKGMKQGYWKKTNELGELKYEGTFADNKPTGHSIFLMERKKLKLITV
jgi:hypothetical protein